MNAFDTTGPSIFSKRTAANKGYRLNRHGLTPSQAASRAVAERTAKTGVNPGTLYGISHAEWLANIRPVWEGR